MEYRLENLRESCSLRSAKVGIFATYSAEVYDIASCTFLCRCPVHQLTAARLVFMPSLNSVSQTVWNSLPGYLRNPVVGYDQFRRDLKMVLLHPPCVFVVSALEVSLLYCFI